MHSMQIASVMKGSVSIGRVLGTPLKCISFFFRLLPQEWSRLVSNLSRMLYVLDSFQLHSEHLFSPLRYNICTVSRSFSTESMCPMRIMFAVCVSALASTNGGSKRCSVDDIETIGGNGEYIGTVLRDCARKDKDDIISCMIQTLMVSKDDEQVPDEDATPDIATSDDCNDCSLEVFGNPEVQDAWNTCIESPDDSACVDKIPTVGKIWDEKCLPDNSLPTTSTATLSPSPI
jgi:hypothetical protein